MIQNVLTDIGGIGLYGVISTCLFLAVFGGALVWALQLRKPFVESMASLPLQEDEPAARTAEPAPAVAATPPAAKPVALMPRGKGPEIL